VGTPLRGRRADRQVRDERARFHSPSVKQSRGKLDRHAPIPRQDHQFSLEMVLKKNNII